MTTPAGRAVAAEHRPPDGRVLLVSTYELGHQPFGLASPAAWLRQAGFHVDCLDLSRQELDMQLVHLADIVGFHLPMHTATRLAILAAAEVKRINPGARLCFFGLYGQANVDRLVAVGADAVISGEFEAELVRYARSAIGSSVPDGRRVAPLERLVFKVPDRELLPPLESYAQLAIGSSRRLVGYTEATRGCRHVCRHCPVAPVYGGRIRVIGADTVLADVAAQVDAGAQHITFGDPDFLNAPAHAVRIVNALHQSWPEVSYDVTIKIEHLLRHQQLLPVLASTGCSFVTTAVESIDDDVLGLLQKGHTRSDFVEAVGACRRYGLELSPTFVAFHPWLTFPRLVETFELLDDLDLVRTVAPIQLATRLLVPEGSLLLELPDAARLFGPFDADRLVYPWRHPDPRLDELHSRFEVEVARAAEEGTPRELVFDRLWAMAGGTPPTSRSPSSGPDVPQFLESWFCCSEPVGDLTNGWSIGAPSNAP